MPVAVCTIVNSWRWTERPSETCRFIPEENKFEISVHLVGFTIEIYYDARPYERQTLWVFLSSYVLLNEKDDLI